MHSRPAADRAAEPAERDQPDPSNQREQSDQGALAERLASLLAEVDALPANTRARVQGLVSSLLELYGEGLARIVRGADAAQDAALRELFAQDEVVASLLLIHGLHPESAQLDGLDSASGERCEFCGNAVESGHRHLLQTSERRMCCACEPCYALRAGDAAHRPVGSRTLWLPELSLSDELWKRLGVPIGLVFFLRSASAGRVIAVYPSALGTTEADPDAAAWAQLVTENPLLATLEIDAEALLLNRLDGARQAAIVPIDHCYALVGQIREAWDGLQGGDALRQCVPAFFSALEAQSHSDGGRLV